MLRFDVSFDDRLFTVEAGHLVQVRRMADGELVCEFDRVLETVIYNNFLPGTLLVASSGFKGGVFLWDAESGQLLETYSVPKAHPFGLSADRTWLLAKGERGFRGWRIPWLVQGGPLGLARSAGERKLFGLHEEGTAESAEIAALGLDDGSLEAKAIGLDEVEREEKAMVEGNHPVQAHYQF